MGKMQKKTQIGVTVLCLAVAAGGGAYLLKKNTGHASKAREIASEEESDDDLDSKSEGAEHTTSEKSKHPKAHAEKESEKSGDDSSAKSMFSKERFSKLLGMIKPSHEEDEKKPGKKEEIETEQILERPRVDASEEPPVAAKEESHRNNHGVCLSVEYQGEGFQGGQISRAQWNKVVNQFHQAKILLKNWLTHNKAKLPERTITFMQTQVDNVKLMEPPSAEEPDLSWRGIGVFSRGENDQPLIRIGSGFLKWVAKDPKRTQFEMTRLVAQSWAPCEFQRVDAGAPWSSMLKCLEVNEEQGCAGGSFSEGGWAISTTLAYSLSAPGCKVPAFEKSKRNRCVAQVSSPRATLARKSDE